MKKLAVAISLMLLPSCAGSRLGMQARAIRGDIQMARDSGAYRCAPVELALAEAEVEFGELELEQGDYFRARAHLETADEKAHEAVRLSPAAKCAAKNTTAAPSHPRDGDKDGIADADDKCPAEPEDKDGFQDLDGCPEPDNDQDGLIDSRDKCPNEAEDPDGFQDDDGCPDPDNDGDGVLDASDRCPSEKEDRDGFDDNDGCPDPDNDRDGIPDAEDKCPNQVGPRTNGGCPKKYELINITKEKIEIKQTIFFTTAKAVIMAKSYPLLDEVAAAIKERPGMNVRIEGHTDGRGSRPMNIRLSQARADSVRAYLVGHGIGPDRLEAKGFGPDQPIETNKTAAGRDKNRRVEFVITQQ